MKWSDLYMIQKVPSNREQFGNKVIQIAREMNVHPNWLMGLMYFETARTMSHRITNGIGCVGLIQFCSSARRELKVTADQLRNMTNVRQLDYVRDYFMKFSWKRNLVKKVKSVTDLYLIIFYPLAVGKPMDYVLGSHNGTWRSIYKQNPSFKDGTGKVKVRNVVNHINQFLPQFSNGSNTSVTKNEMPKAKDDPIITVDVPEIVVTPKTKPKKPKQKKSSILPLALLFLLFR